jgi:hypothetical protein
LFCITQCCIYTERRLDVIYLWASFSPGLERQRQLPAAEIYRQTGLSCFKRFNPWAVQLTCRWNTRSESNWSPWVIKRVGLLAVHRMVRMSAQVSAVEAQKRSVYPAFLGPE